jgi:hypothetical protein
MKLFRSYTFMVSDESSVTGFRRTAILRSGHSIYRMISPEGHRSQDGAAAGRAAPS